MEIVLELNVAAWRSCCSMKCWVYLFSLDSMVSVAIEVVVFMLDVGDVFYGAVDVAMLYVISVVVEINVDVVV